jgi:hypothetical protein
MESLASGALRASCKVPTNKEKIACAVAWAMKTL